MYIENILLHSVPLEYVFNEDVEEDLEDVILKLWEFDKNISF